MANEPWQIQVVRRSIKKKDKVRLLGKIIPYDQTRTALDLGCAQGTLSHFLRRKGGFWVSTDQDFLNLKTAREFLGRNFVQMAPGVIPFRGESFELVACLDYLEHITNDDECLAEVSRVLKRGAELLLIVPQTGRFFPVHKLRRAAGMKLEFYGHKREGYRLDELKGKLEKAGLEFVRRKSYSHIFSELLELILNLAYIKLFARKKSPAEGLRDGYIKPSTEGEFKALGKRMKLYSVVYPFLWLATRLDRILFFLRGYSLLVIARKP